MNSQSWTLCPIRPGFEDEDVTGDWADRSSKDTVVNSFQVVNHC